MVGEIKSLIVEGYRSIRDLRVDFDQVNLITGPNGCGKSNLFQSLRLVKSAIEGRLAEGLSETGGLNQLFWAGRQPNEPEMRIRLECDPYSYELLIKLPNSASANAMFPHDPIIESEVLKLAGRVMVKRGKSLAEVRDLDGPFHPKVNLIESESIFSQIEDAGDYNYLYQFRQLASRWMFYHDFRTDQDSPIRRPGLPTFSRRLREDGSNLGPILSIVERYGDFHVLEPILKEAFPGSEFQFQLDRPIQKSEGIRRPLDVAEMSDGTLKFLCLAAACFSRYPPPLIAFNEPENSLNPATLGPLADMLTHASMRSQLWVTTHSAELTKAITDRIGCLPIRLDKFGGETMMADVAARRKDLQK